MRLSERVRVREQDALEAGGPTLPRTGCAPDLATVPPTESCCRVCGQGYYWSVANGLPNSSASAPKIAKGSRRLPLVDQILYLHLSIRPLSRSNQHDKKSYLILGLRGSYLSQVLSRFFAIV
jgi:hypothetical protein